jgi:hypothetical protein
MTKSPCLPGCAGSSWTTYWITRAPSLARDFLPHISTGTLPVPTHSMLEVALFIACGVMLGAVLADLMGA